MKVTEEDLRKGYEANYGPRVRCLAIVLGNQRRAQQVFELARKNNTTEYFGELAAQYSIEPGSQAMHGEVPPIKKYGGQPQLEEEAFQLRPGELSGVIQVGDKFIILRCEGHTKPANVDFNSVRNDLYDDMLRKETPPGDGRVLREAARGGHGGQLPGRHQPLAEVRPRRGELPHRTTQTPPTPGPPNPIP